jgi:serine/threonine protein kinase HipA of HipAB toxin-antitoxin module
MPRVAKTIDDAALLNAAMEGLEARRQRIEDQIRAVRARIRGAAPKTPSAKPAPAKKGKKRTLSAAARKRISIAQKKRWAEYHEKAPSK